ncbi:hypothetical protein [Nocardia cyriacigeorgica]|uniref:hypothetical protein n=1 Tax=Nocardia cyriacigeorgica TaxID=135487 RepID=UPI0006628BED|nr:hypothetical protein [Nocardia cyriacigeorgica]
MTLTQPWATLIAGLLALTAAAVAYRGVLLNIREQRRGEHRKAALEVLASALAALNDFENAYLKRWVSPSPEAADVAQLEDAAFEHLDNIAAMLELYGMNEAAEAVSAVTNDTSGGPEYSSDPLAFSTAREALVSARKNLFA